MILKTKLHFVKFLIAIFCFIILLPQNNFGRSFQFINTIIEKQSEKRIFGEINSNKFDIAYIHLNNHIEKFGKNAVTAYFGYLVYSQKNNSNYSLVNSYLNLNYILQNYKFLNKKQIDENLRKYYINEILLKSLSNHIQNDLIQEYCNSVDSINMLIDILKNENFTNTAFEIKIKSKMDKLLFKDVSEVNIIDAKPISKAVHAINNSKLTPEYIAVYQNDTTNNFSNSNIKYSSNNNYQVIIADIKTGCQLIVDKNKANLRIKWHGECKDGFVNGVGKCEFFNSETLVYTYVGNFIKGKISNPITAYYPNGTKFIGEMNNNMFVKGTYTAADGTTYTCSWKDGKLNGEGTSVDSQGVKYEGVWKDNKRNGKGVLTMPDGSKYIGEWNNNKLNGQVTYIFSDGSKFIGQMENNQINGFGTCYYVDGTVYVGEWKDGEMSGKGLITKTNGEKYDGELIKGKENGNGAYYFADGSYYSGSWVDGKRNGLGTMTFSDGSKYSGQWLNNKMNGHGVIDYKFGDSYEGEWKDGKKFGQGTYTFGDGCKHIGMWNGERMSYGKVYTSNGVIAYDGDMENYYR